MKKIIVALAFFLPVFVSCKKDKTSCDLSQASFSGKYKIVALKYKASATASEMDIYQSLDACAKDDFIIFNSTGNYTYQDAGVTCNPAGDDSGTWSLSGKTIVMDGESSAVSAFDCNNATIVSTDPNSGEITTVSIVRQ